jgi:hypothetical protein
LIRTSNSGWPEKPPPPPPRIIITSLRIIPKIEKQLRKKFQHVKEEVMMRQTHPIHSSSSKIIPAKKMAITILAGTNEIEEDEEERKKARKGRLEP